MTHVIHKIPPVYNKNSQILILGSFPSVKSREGRFFYHHKQNRFWKVLSTIVNDVLPETIDEKKDFLLKFANMEQTELEKGEGIEPLRALQKGYTMRLKETNYTSIGVDLPEHVALVENIIRKNNVSI